MAVCGLLFFAYPSSPSATATPYTENRQLQQAALQETGQASFLNGLSYDNQLSIDDQQKLILYSNAIAWAEANNAKLGQSLSDQQLAALDQPMLWYVEQSVPDPSCALASTECPSITVLMPQLYLTQAQGKLTGGLIAGQDINLDLTERLTNTGIVTGTTLNVTTSTLENIQRSVDIGKSAYRVEGGWQEVFGTQLAPGGFMSATSIDLHASTITAIGDALKIVNPDGSPNTAATQALIAQLAANLGSNYSQTDAHDNIQTNFIKEEKGLGTIGTLVVMIALAVVTAGAAAEVLAAMQIEAATAMLETVAMGGTFAEAAAAGGMMASTAFAAGGFANLAIAGAIGSMASSVGGQLAMGGKLDFGSVLKAGVSGAISGGVTGYFGGTYDVTRLLATTATGCVSAELNGGSCESGAKSGFVSGAIAWSANAMRADQIESSQRFKGIRDKETGDLITNLSGPSSGIDGSGDKLAGTRPSFDELSKYGKVAINDDGSWTFARSSDVAMGLNPETQDTWTINQALAKTGGLTGGAQSLPGTLAGALYPVGGFRDKLLESFAGPHDYLGSLTAYDDIGNLKSLTSIQKNLFEIQTDMDLFIAAPFAWVTLLNQYGLNTQTLSNQLNQVQKKP